MSLLSLLKMLDGSWDKAREYLRSDLEHIEVAWNQQQGATFNEDNTLKSSTIAESVAGDSTADSRYISNQGPDHTPMWVQVNLSNGVKARLPLAKLVPSTRAGIVIGRGNTIAGDLQELTLGPGLTLNGIQLRAHAGSGSAEGPEGEPGPRGQRGRQGERGMRGRVIRGEDGDDGETILVRRRFDGMPTTKLGQAVLVGGTVTVTTPEIRTGSLVFLQRKTAGGTTGELTYTQTDNTSFVINSSSATDTSTVNWVILDNR